MSDPDRKKRIDRIRKLIALAGGRGATDHEAALALEMAQRAMAEEGITETDLLAAEAAESYARSGAQQRVPKWESALATVIGQGFACDLVHHGYEVQWSFVGIDPLPELASYAFQVLFRQCQKARTAYIATELKRVKRRAVKTRRADQFCDGWVLTASKKIRSISRPARHSSAITAFKQQRYGQLVSLTTTDRNAGRNLRDHDWRDIDAGMRQGDDAELRNGVGLGAGPVGLIEDRG